MFNSVFCCKCSRPVEGVLSVIAWFLTQVRDQTRQCGCFCNCLLQTTYYIPKKRLVWHSLVLQYTSKLARMHCAQTSSIYEMLLFLFFFCLINFINKCSAGLVGCNIAVHCIVGNSRRGRLIRCMIRWKMGRYAFFFTWDLVFCFNSITNVNNRFI